MEYQAGGRAIAIRFPVRLIMRRTAKELAEAIGARLEGDGAIELAGIAAPERAGARDLIYVDAAKHAQRAAELLLGRAPIASGIHSTAIVAPLARIAAGVGIGPYAVIGEDAHVGAGTQIGAHSVIGAGCWIGGNCRIHPRVTLYAGVRLGSRVEIHSGAVIGADGFGYAQGEGKYWKFPQTGIVEIGDDVEIGANTTIARGSLDDTRIAEGVKLDNLVQVGHNCQIGAHSVIAAQVGLSGSCVFGRHVVVGGQAGFGERCKLEDKSVIGGQSGVLGGKTIRSGEAVWGTPARSLEKFKELFAWYGRLPELAARIKGIEEKLGGK